MASTPNNTINVSVGKGVTGGYMFVAPQGSDLPTDFEGELDAAFLNVGYLGDDGIVFSDSSSNDSFYDLNGDSIETSASEIEKTFTVTFREIKKDTLAILVGSANVTDADGKLTAHDKGPNDAAYPVVFELLLKNGRKWRRVVPNCKVGELGDMTVVSTELIGREVTMSALKDATSGDYYTDYYASTETSHVGA